MARERLDKIVVERGFAESRSRAQAMILAGQVLVRDQRIDKPSHLVDSLAEIRIKSETLRYVSRGGLKLEAALREFSVDADGKICIDIGASTGGFTDCLLQQGASRVWAVDVGHNQLAWQIRQDDRVVVLEGVNARGLDPAQFPTSFDIATIDVSFISLNKILRAVRQVITDVGHCVALVKPQFEVGRGEVGRGGIVTDPAKHRRVLGEIVSCATAERFCTWGLIGSPIRGAEGNREFFAHLRPDSLPNPTVYNATDAIAQLTSIEEI